MDDEFFDKYEKAHEEDKGIPGFQMNAPMTTNALLGKIGIELELEPSGRSALPRDGHLEAIKTPKTGAGWRSVEDGSLRNGGREYIVSAPILKEELPAAVEALWGVFSLMGVQLGNSNRCSTHVHINASGLTVNQLTSVIVLWGTFEEAIINWCGEERTKNHFCLSTKDTGSLVQAWDRMLSTGQIGHFDRNLRYSALNVNPIWDRGSIEFRCGPAADTPDIPVKWASFIHDFVNYAVKAYPNPEQIAHDLSERGGWNIFQDISKGTEDAVGAGICSEIIGEKSPGEFDEISLSGFRNVQRLALGHPWGEWLDLINREYVPNPFAKAGSGKRIRQIDPIPVHDPEDGIPAGNRAVRPRRTRTLRMTPEGRIEPAGDWVEPAPPFPVDPEDRPWEQVAAQVEREFLRRDPAAPPPPPAPAPTRAIREGDRVEYISGDMRPRGSTGTVIRQQTDRTGVIGWFVQWDRDGDRGDAALRWCMLDRLRLIQVEQDQIRDRW